MTRASGIGTIAFRTVQVLTAVVFLASATLPIAASAEVVLCKPLNQTNIIGCGEGADATANACAGTEAQAVCGFPMDPSKCWLDTVQANDCAEARGLTTPLPCADLKTKLNAQDAKCQPTCASGYKEDASGKCDTGKCCIKAGTGGPAPTAKAQFAMPDIDPAEFIGKIVRLIFGISGSLAFAMIIYGGFLWLTSGGAPETMNKAKNVVIWAVLGLAVIFVAYAAVANILDFVFQAVTTSTK